jgi:ferredoxin-nitrite reductase
LTWLCEANTCPGLYYGTSAKDGFLLRPRTPGGLVSLAQGEAIALLLANCGQDTLQVTNRANLQIRGVKNPPSAQMYQRLQKVGLGGKQEKLDNLRNVMLSPTVGIEVEELLDTRPLMQQILTYVEQHPELAQLSPKFSVGLDGGGRVAIGGRSPLASEHRYNELQWSAVTQNQQIYLHLSLGVDKQLWDTGILIKPQDLIPFFASLMGVYLDYVQTSSSSREKTPRLRDLLQDWGLSTYLEKVTRQTTVNYQVAKINLTPSLPHGDLGIYPQKQQGYSYIGVSLPLGHITLRQWQGLLELVKEFGQGEIRLTPWQSILLPYLPTQKIDRIVAKLEELDLSLSNNAYQGAIVACAGKPGCKAALTQTQAHAMTLIKHLQNTVTLKHPVNIHLTGCPKSCAQPSPAQITLLGTMVEQGEKLVEGYKIYLSELGEIAELPFEEVPTMTEKLVKQWG